MTFSRTNRQDEGPGNRVPPDGARERLLTEASRLFYNRGLRGVGIEAIVEQADVARMTLYNQFGSKDGLIAECLAYLDTRYHDWFVRQVTARTQDPRERLLVIFDVLDDWFRSSTFRGCAFINASVELADPQHPGHEAIVAHKRRTRDYLRELAEDAGARDVVGLSEALMLLIEGAVVTALVERDYEAALRARRTARILLAALVDRGGADVALGDAYPNGDAA